MPTDQGSWKPVFSHQHVPATTAHTQGTLSLSTGHGPGVQVFRENLGYIHSSSSSCGKAALGQSLHRQGKYKLSVQGLHRRQPAPSFFCFCTKWRGDPRASTKGSLHV